MASTTKTGQRSHRRAVWLLLLALAWVQLAWTGHQFHHAAADFGSPCAVCVQLDRLDAVAEDAPIEARHHVPALPVPGEDIAFLPASFRAAYSPRAPPSV